MKRKAGRVLRRTVMVVAALLALGVVAVVLMRDTLIPTLIERAARSTTGARVVIGGAFHLERVAPLTFEAREITISAAHGDARIELARAEVPLRALLTGEIHFTLLALQGARIEPVPGNRAAAGEARARLPAVEHLELEDVQLALPGAAGAPVHTVTITRLAARAQPDGQFRAQGTGSVAGAPWQLDGALGTLGELLDSGVAFPVVARVDFPSRGVVVQLNGSIDDPFGGHGASLDMRATVADVAWFVETFAPGAPLAGSLQVSGRLQGAFDALAATGLDLRLDDGSRLDVSVSGDAKDLFRLAGLALDVDAGTADPQVLHALGLDAASGFEAGRVRATLTGGRGAYRLEGIDVALSGAASRAVELRGVAELDALAIPDGVRTFRVELSAAAPASALAALMPGLADAGRIDLQTTIEGGEAGLSFAPLALRMEETAPIAGAVSGRVALSPRWRAALDGGGAGGGGAGGAASLLDGATLDLAVDLAGDLRGAGALIAVEAPPAGPFTLRAKVSGQAGRIEVAELDARLTAGDPLRARLAGTLALVAGDEPPWSLAAVNLDVEASGQDASNLPALPHLRTVGDGPWKASGTLESRGEALAVRHLRFESGSEETLRTELRGEVEALGPYGPSVLAESSGVKGSVRVASASTQRLGEVVHLALPDLGRAELSFDAALDGDTWTLRKIEGGVSGAGVELSASGAALGIPTAAGFAVQIEGRAADAAGLADKLGVALPIVGALSVNGQLARRDARFSFDGSLGLGPTVLTGKAELDTSGPRPSALVSVATPVLDIGDLGGMSAVSAPGRDDGGGDASGRRLFSTAPLDLRWLAAADVEASLDAKVLRSGALEAGPLKLKGTSAGGRLHVSIDDFSFESGEIRATLDVDASRSPPTFSIEGRGKALSLGHAHARVAPDANRLEGLYAFEIDLEASGRSGHELASTASGHYAHVVADARLPGGDLDVLALRPLELVISHANAKDHTRVDCSVVLLRAKDGIATSERLFIRTDKMLVAGVGRFDLGAETVDVVVHTKPVHEGLLDLFKGKHAARVHGPITDLKLDADASSVVVGAALEGGLLGAAAMNPPVFAAIVGIKFLDEAAKGEQAKSCHP